MQQYHNTDACLEDLREGFRRRFRGCRVRRVHISQRRIERAVSKVLPDKESVGTLLDHQHRSGVPARLLYRRCAERGRRVIEDPFWNFV